ncbi:MAG: hypothetical protein GVY32_11175 [Gammaproteobacteria bacterium]|nr:hypothetical protein [Gammaproteobacteria bacterium]
MFETVDRRAFASDDDERWGQRALDALDEAGKLLAREGDAERRLPPVLRVLGSFTGLRHGLVVLTGGPAGTAIGGRFAAAAEPLVAPAQETALAPVIGGVLTTGVAAVVKDVVAEHGADAAPEPITDDAVAA